MKTAAPMKAMKAEKNAAMKRRATKEAAPAKAMKAMKKIAMRRHDIKAAAPAKALQKAAMKGRAIKAAAPIVHVTQRLTDQEVEQYRLVDIAEEDERYEPIIHFALILAPGSRQLVEAT